METTFTQAKYKPAPGTQARRQTDWTVMSNETLKFAYDLASLHDSPHEAEIMNEISRRIERGAWLEIDHQVPIQADVVPWIFHVFPFSLLWRQASRK